MCFVTRAGSAAPECACYTYDLLCFSKVHDIVFVSKRNFLVQAVACMLAYGEDGLMLDVCGVIVIVVLYYVMDWAGYSSYATQSLLFRMFFVTLFVADMVKKSIIRLPFLGAPRIVQCVI